MCAAWLSADGRRGYPGRDEWWMVRLCSLGWLGLARQEHHGPIALTNSIFKVRVCLDSKDPFRTNTWVLFLLHGTEMAAASACHKGN